MSNNAENELFGALVEITGSGFAKEAAAMGAYAAEADTKKPDAKVVAGKKVEVAAPEAEVKKEAGIKLASIIDNPLFLKGFERRLGELSDEHGFLEG